jgi:murein biosynthesis integral membrane protein MurJ
MTLLAKLKNYPIIRSSIVLIIITLLVKILGYSEKLLLAYYWGTGIEVDTYTLVTTIILAIFFLFREIIEPGYLIVFLKLRTEKGEQAAWHLFKSISLIITLLTITLTVLIIVFPNDVINFFAPGFSVGNNNMASRLIKIAGSACIFLALSTLTYITLNAYKQFALAALGDFMQKAAILLMIVLLYPKFGIYAAAIGILAGAIARLFAHLPLLIREMTFKFKIQIEKKPLLNVWYLTWPLLIGVLFSQVSSLTDNIFASYLPEGSISALSYSRKLVELPIVVLPYAVSVVIFPFLSQYVIEKQTDKIQATIFESLKWIAIIFIPLSIFFGIMSLHLVEVVFQRGAFDAASTSLTAKPMTIYSIGMLLFALETVIVIFYFAFADTKTPIFTGIACSLLNIFLTFILIRPLGYLGIALSLVISKTIKVTILTVLLSKKITLQLNNIFRFIYRLTPGILIYSMSIVLMRQYFENELTTKSILYKFLILCVGFSLSGILYILISNKYLKLFRVCP